MRIIIVDWIWSKIKRTAKSEFTFTIGGATGSSITLVVAIGSVDGAVL